jgi:HEAT repeat protein
MVWIMFALFAAPTSVLAQQQNASGQSADQQLLHEFMMRTPDEIVEHYFRAPPYPIFAIRRLMEIGGPAVIPDLEQAFTRERGEAAREFLAAALIDLGDTKQEYFDYVATRAATAVASGLPSPVQLGTREEPAGSPPRLNAAFVHWVRLHDIGLESAVQQATFEIPTAVEALGEADDPRSRSIFLQGLRSPNIFVVFAAALGLARLQDRKAVPSIITAATREPCQERRMIAKALLYFDTPKAQHAAEHLIADPVLLHRWRVEVKERGWKKAMRDTGQ